MIYIYFFIALFIFSFSKGKSVLYKVSLFAILCLTCFRAQHIGVDTADGYLSYFTSIKSNIYLGFVEPGWILLNKFSILLGLDYQGVLILSGILTLLPISYVIQRTCKNQSYALAIYYGMYFVLNSYNLMRQMIAISFTLLAIFFYIKKKYSLSIFWFILGLSFHKSIIVILPIICFLRLKAIRYSKILILIIISFIGGLLLSDSFFFLISGSYSHYFLNSGSLAGFRNSLLKPALLALAFDAFFLFLIYFNYKIIRSDPWFLVSLLGVIVMNLTMRMGQGTRIVLYFSQAQMICLSNHLQNIKPYNNKIILNIVYISYLMINFMRILINQWESLNPYRFFWSM